jgi:hypothetical protein
VNKASLEPLSLPPSLSLSASQGMLSDQWPLALAATRVTTRRQAAAAGSRQADSSPALRQQKQADDTKHARRHAHACRLWRCTLQANTGPNCKGVSTCLLCLPPLFLPASRSIPTPTPPPRPSFAYPPLLPRRAPCLTHFSPSFSHAHRIHRLPSPLTTPLSPLRFPAAAALSPKALCPYLSSPTLAPACALTTHLVFSLWHKFQAWHNIHRLQLLEEKVARIRNL